MAARYNRAWQSPYASRDLPASEKNIYLSEDEALVSEEANNRRIRQAISYLSREGGTESLSKYQYHVGKINECIIHQYPNEGYPYDERLYRQLRTMVRERLTEFRGLGTDDDELRNNGEDSEDFDSEDALHRSEEELDEGFDHTSRDKPGPSKPKQSSAPKSTTQLSKPPKVPLREPLAQSPTEELPSATVYQYQWRYGGPNNEVEELRKDYPALLPFGESFYMREWESMKINNDLRQSAENKNNPDANLSKERSKVDFRDAVEIVGSKKGLYDSGSRFKLPYDETIQNFVDDNPNFFSLSAAVREFNEGGPGDWKKKDYAPRIFLENVQVHPDFDEEAPVERPTFVASARRGSSHASQVSGLGSDTVHGIRSGSRTDRSSSSSKQTTRSSSGTAAPSSPIVSRRSTSQVNPSAGLRDSSPPTAGPASSRSSTKSSTTNKTPSSSSKRTSSQPPPQSSRSRPSGRTRSSSSATVRASSIASEETAQPKKTPRSVKHVLPTPPGTVSRSERPPRAPSSPTPLTTRSKRKAVDADDHTTEASTQSKGKRAKTAAKRVAFASGDALENVAPVPQRRGQEKSKANPAPRSFTPERDPVRERATRRSAEGFERVKRGTTRSGMKFKKR